MNSVLTSKMIKSCRKGGMKSVDIHSRVAVKHDDDQECRGEEALRLAKRLDRELESWSGLIAARVLSYMYAHERKR